MTAYLMTWNPTLYPYDRYDEDVATTRTNATVEAGWRVADKYVFFDTSATVYLFRFGADRGILGTGRIVDGERYKDWDWEVAGRKVWYVRVEWTHLLPVEDVLPQAELSRQVGFEWDSVRPSGMPVRGTAESQLAETWAKHLRV